MIKNLAYNFFFLLVKYIYMFKSINLLKKMENMFIKEKSRSLNSIFPKQPRDYKDGQG